MKKKVLEWLLALSIGCSGILFLLVACAVVVCIVMLVWNNVFAPAFGMAGLTFAKAAVIFLLILFFLSISTSK